MKFFDIITIIAISSFFISGFIAFILLRWFNWENQKKYWFMTCLLIPTLLFIYSSYSLFIFTSPSDAEIFDISQPDSGPMSFFYFLISGIFIPIAYICVSAPVSYLMLRLFSRP